MRLQIGALGLAIVCASGLVGSAEDAHSAVLDRTFAVAQAMIPPTGMGPADKAMAAQDMAETARMQRRFPQPVRVGDLIGLPVLDDDSRTLGHVRQVVRTPQGKIKLIVAYGGFLGFGIRDWSRCRSKWWEFLGGNSLRSICRGGTMPPRRHGGTPQMLPCRTMTVSASRWLAVESRPPDHDSVNTITFWCFET